MTTTHSDLAAMIRELEQHLAQDTLVVQNLQTALEDCDPRELFAIAPEMIPDMPRPVRRSALSSLPAHFIRV